MGLAAVLVFLSAVIGVEALVADSVSVAEGQVSRGYWAEAIQAVSTVVVMAATTVYAAITYRMVQVMKQQTATMSTSSTRAHVTELSRFLMTWIRPLLRLKSSVASQLQSPVDTISELDNGIERVYDAIFELASFGSACPPDMMDLVKPTTDASFEAIRLVQLVRQSIIEAARSATDGEDSAVQLDLYRRLYPSDPISTAQPLSDSREFDPSWDDVRNEYLLHIRDAAPGRPEWDDIIAAKWLDDIEVVRKELIKACTSYLLRT